ITRPDYRSLPTSAATSQSSVPSTPVTIPTKNAVEQIVFREFGAPIATPEDEEMLDELMEIKSEPVLSPRRTYTDFEEKENREEEDTTLREETMEEEISEIESIQNSEELLPPPTKTDFIRMVESAPELNHPEEEEEEEDRKIRESYGEPRKAVLERLNYTTDDDETETENEEMDEEDDVDEDVRRQVSRLL
uniref:DIDO1 n=1 Tax=Caenorhabditis tropicalis TaxID=1561998 RepID=A0A1I7SY92_9PELO